MEKYILQHPPEAGVGDATFEIPLPALERGKKLVLSSSTCFSQPRANGVRFAVLVSGHEVWSGEQKDLVPADLQLDLSSSTSPARPLQLDLSSSTSPAGPGRRSR